MITRCVVGRGVTGAVRYILGEGRNAENGEHAILGENGASRVAWIGGTGFGFDIENQADADLGRRIMEFDALHQNSRTRQCEKDCVHIALGWRPGEMPSRVDMEQAAHSVLRSLGMEKAKAIFASHTDESYSHLHIVASKINPDTGKAYDLRGNYLKLSRWAQDYEKEHGGIICLRREDANRLRDAITARDPEAVIEAMTEQRATFTEADLDRALRKQVKGTLARAVFSKKVLGHATIVKLRDTAFGTTSRYTTHAVLKAEHYVIGAAEVMTKDKGHDTGDRIRAAVLGSPAFSTMRPEQAHAVREATGAAGLSLIDGQAGTGKSYTMSAIRQIYEAAGRHVIGLAPTNVVAQDMQRDGFKKATTVHSQLFALNNGRQSWNRQTVVMIDEAAMLDTKLMAMLTTYARAAGAKMILVGDDRQLNSIERGGMFIVLKHRYGAATLSEVLRQRKDDDRRASSMMAEGNFHDALKMYDAKGAISWTQNQNQARAALVKEWAKESAAFPDKSRFVFAYTNSDVAYLNADLRAVRRARGELGDDHVLPTAEGKQAFASGDRVQLTGTNKAAGLYNGMIGTIEKIKGNEMTVMFDGRKPTSRMIDAKLFQDFRHGYAGTIYKGQGRTLSHTYLYHSEHWRSGASYVALTRHREKALLFAARNTAADVRQLARQMARVDDRSAASRFFHDEEVGSFDSVRAVAPRQVVAEMGGIIGKGFVRSHQVEIPHETEELKKEDEAKPVSKPIPQVRSEPAAVDTSRPQENAAADERLRRVKMDLERNSGVPREEVGLPNQATKPGQKPPAAPEVPLVAEKAKSVDAEEERIRRVLLDLNRNAGYAKEKATTAPVRTYQDLKAEQAKANPMTPEEAERERVRRVMLDLQRNSKRIDRERSR